MKYWKTTGTKTEYVKGDKIDLYMDRMMSVYSKRRELNEEWFNSEMLRLTEKLRKELEV